MSPTIDVDDYVAAFRAWISVAQGPDLDANLRTRQRAFVDEAGHWITARFRGVVEIQQLCEALSRWAYPRMRDLALPEIGKSCLLSRLIYGGEQLRTRRCPLHNGRWSGFGIESCLAGCSYGLNLTGWLPNDRVEEWPAAVSDPGVEMLEATLREHFGAGELAVYADRLQMLGDVRGELIAIDLAGRVTPELAARRDQLAATWLGRLASPPDAELRSPLALSRPPRVRTGFVDATITTPADVRALFDHPAGRYLRWLRIDAPPYEAGGIVRFLALRDHAWLAEVTITDQPAVAGDALAELQRRAPLLRSSCVVS